jgi:protein-tyrosine phosphatase
MGFAGVVAGWMSIALAGSAGAYTQTVSSSSTGARYGHRIEAKGVPGLVEITPRLYRGGQPTAEGFRALAAMGIGIVVDERELHWTERRRVTKLGMQYVALRWFCLFPRDEIFAKFLALIRDNPTKKIFVHCRLGDDRVAMTIAAFRMADEHWTAEQAMEEMQTRGFTLRHHLICPRLAEYEKEFPARYRSDPIFRSSGRGLTHNKGTREQGNKGTRERGNEGTRERAPCGRLGAWFPHPFAR